MISQHRLLVHDFAFKIMAFSFILEDVQYDVHCRAAGTSFDIFTFYSLFFIVFELKGVYSLLILSCLRLTSRF